jgi:hypothetical protein
MTEGAYRDPLPLRLTLRVPLSAGKPLQRATPHTASVVIEEFLLRREVLPVRLTSTPEIGSCAPGRRAS